MGDLDWDVRVDVFRHLAATGRAPSVQETAGELGLETATVEAARRRLADAHVLALKSGTYEVWMAHPFSAEATGFRVVAESGAWWANCAWDALAIPSMLEVDARIEACCPDCDYQFDFSVSDGRLTGDDGLVHFVVPPSRFWEDIGFT